MLFPRLTICLWTLLALASCATSRYRKEQNTIDQLIRSDAFLQTKLDSFARYETQIVYIQIDRGRDNKPHFKTFTWNENPLHYFYPASTVKMPAALIAVEKINELSLSHPGLTLFSPMKIDSARPPQSAVNGDSTSWNYKASVGQYLKKIFAVSDNDAFNRLYEFTGQAYLNKRLKKLGYKHTHIIHRLDAPEFDFVSNKYTNPVHFYEEDIKLYDQAELYNPADVRVPNLESLQKGEGYISGDSVIHRPFQFGFKNFFALSDMAQMIRSIMFHEYIPTAKPFNITPEQLAYIRQCMSTLPRESRYPSYDTSYHDGYAKFFIVGGSRDTLPAHLRIFNKAGWAYGYLSDAAYIVDFHNKTEFIVAATISTNSDGIFNDGIYSYETLGLPYLSRLGTLFYNYELKRPRKHLPDLTPFRFEKKE